MLEYSHGPGLQIALVSDSTQYVAFSSPIVSHSQHHLPVVAAVKSGA